MDREHILDEIRRTAVENGGQPLGKTRFAAATGIKPYDWEPYWGSRWGDALAEAGFEPLTLRAAADQSYLLQTYATLAKKLGRLPSEGDLRIAHHADPAFPSSKTFAARLGTKAQLVCELRKYIDARDEYALLLPLCDRYQTPMSRPPKRVPAPSAKDGCVYLIKSGRFYKIGRSNAAGRREYEIALQLPDSIQMVHVIRTDDAPGIEAYWHSRFAPKRKNGEWFQLDAEDVAAFKRRKFM